MYRGPLRRKASQCRVENQQTQPTYDAKSVNRIPAILVGGECSQEETMYAKIANKFV